MPLVRLAALKELPTIAGQMLRSKSRSGRRGFARGTVVWTLATAELVSWGTLYYSFSLFVLPMQQELGWSKAELNGALSLGLLIVGMSGLPVGSWIDRHGGRLLMTLGSLGGAALLLAWSRIESLASFYLLWALMGMVLASVLYDPAFVVLTREYGADAKRSILTLTLVAGFASTVFIPLIQFLLDRLSWRSTLQVLALCNLAVPALLHAVFVPGGRAASESATAVTEAPVARSESALPSPLRAALGTTTFWCLLLSFAAAGATSSSVIFHIIPLLHERGVDTTTIVACIAVIGPMQVAGRLLLYAFGARLGADVLGSVNALALPLALLALLLLPTSLPSLVVFAAIYGLGNGIMTIVRGTAVVDLIGREGFGSINGTLAFPYGLALAAAPLGAALLWSAWGSYQPVLWTMFGTACLSGIAFWLAVASARRRGRVAREVA